MFIRGLGIQYSVRNALTHESTDFYPLERIKSFYIFESPDGLKFGHFFAVKLVESGTTENRADMEGKEEIVILFEVQVKIALRICFQNINYLENETSCGIFKASS